MVALMVMSACGASGYRAEEDARFDGAWELISLEPSHDHGRVMMTFDTTVMNVQVTTTCRSLLGSYTLSDDGTAGLSLPGGTTSVCSGTNDRRDQELALMLESVQRWEQIGDTLILHTSHADLRFDRR